MKSTKFTDLLGNIYNFEFDGAYITIIIHNECSTISIKGIIENNQAWQNITDYINMSPDSIKYIEKFCKNIAFW